MSVSGVFETDCVSVSAQIHTEAVGLRGGGRKLYLFPVTKGGVDGKVFGYNLCRDTNYNSQALSAGAYALRCVSLSMYLNPSCWQLTTSRQLHPASRSVLGQSGSC